MSEQVEGADTARSEARSSDDRATPARSDEQFVAMIKTRLRSSRPTLFGNEAVTRLVRIIDQQKSDLAFARADAGWDG